MKGALDIHRELLGREILHEIVRLPRVVLNADEIPDVLGIDAGQVVSVRLYVAGTRVLAAAVPADQVPDLEAVRQAAGVARIRPATIQEVNEATEYAAGLVAPLLLPVDISLYADPRLGRHDVVYTATGDTGTALGIGIAELLVATGARIADLVSPSVIDVTDARPGLTVELEV
jgi:prolyl-tRNA editing enzyme YbaK/EbsC (Cys-tRNA(Pro) deacylase)